MEFLSSETCRCHHRLTTNYRVFTPYTGINRSSSISTITSARMTGMLPAILEDLAVSCCRACKLHGQSFVDFSMNGRNLPAEQTSDQSVKSIIDHDTDFSFPIYGWKWLKTYNAYYLYIPLVESPGIVHIAIMDQHEDGALLIVKTVFRTWPLMLITLLMAVIAGIVIWFLVGAVYIPPPPPNSFPSTSLV